MEDNVRIRAHRTLKRLICYRSLVDTHSIRPVYIQDISFMERELLIGVYENNPENPEDNIIITNHGLRVLRTGVWRFIEYSKIKEVQGPDNKISSDNITLTLKDNGKVFLNISCNDGKYRDIFGFVRFINRVVEDIS